jgi:hypothetical protein
MDEVEKKLAEELGLKAEEHYGLTRYKNMEWPTCLTFESDHPLWRALVSERRKSESTQHKEWVSVEDRLPEDDGLILIWNGVNVIFGRYESYPKGKRFSYAGGGEVLRPTHWQALPAPPDTSKGQG